jgi:outer membrane immunogenic protein
MRKQVLCCSVFALLGFLTSPAAAAPPPIFTWTGFYVGVSGGGGWGTSPWREDQTGVIEARLSGSGAIFGATAGFNWQNGPWVYGLTADISRANIWTKTTNMNFPNGANSELDWLGTARARLGFLATPTVLIYGTGGLAVGGIHSWYDNGPGQADNRHITKTGWTAGAGIEVGAGGGWTIRLEYLYVAFGPTQVGIVVPPPPPPPPPPPVVSYSADNFRASIIRLGADFHF